MVVPKETSVVPLFCVPVLLFSVHHCVRNRLTRQKLGGSEVGSKPNEHMKDETACLIAPRLQAVYL